MSLQSSSLAKTAPRPGPSARDIRVSRCTTRDAVTECAPAVFDENGALANFDEAVGELVNTTGRPVLRLLQRSDATNERMRHGMYWSGDLAYRDADGWIYLAGRTADWMRVDGENLAAAPIERILQRLAPINQVAVYGVPDEQVGDQVMAAVVLDEGQSLTPEEFEKFLAAQPDLSPRHGPASCGSTTSCRRRRPTSPETRTDSRGCDRSPRRLVGAGGPRHNLRRGRVARELSGSQ